MSPETGNPTSPSFLQTWLERHAAGRIGGMEANARIADARRAVSECKQAVEDSEASAMANGGAQIADPETGEVGFAEISGSNEAMRKAKLTWALSLSPAHQSHLKALRDAEHTLSRVMTEVETNIDRMREARAALEFGASYLTYRTALTSALNGKGD